jgi:hypothetical protein
LLFNNRINVRKNKNNGANLKGFAKIVNKFGFKFAIEK